jgi:hypothetical protein
MTWRLYRGGSSGQFGACAVYLALPGDPMIAPAPPHDTLDFHPRG